MEMATAAAERSEVECGGEPQEEPKNKEMIAGSRGEWHQSEKRTQIRDLHPFGCPPPHLPPPYVSAAQGNDVAPLDCDRCLIMSRRPFYVAVCSHSAVRCVFFFFFFSGRGRHGACNRAVQQPLRGTAITWWLRYVRTRGNTARKQRGGERWRHGRKIFV